MFLSVIALALIVGALAGGGLPRLSELRLRWIPLLFLALALRVGAVLLRQNDLGTDLPLELAWIVAYLLIFAWLWGNWRVPGLQVASFGILLNALAVMLNSGQMPIWAGAFDAAGFTPAALANDPFHFILSASTAADFVARGGLFGDVVPVPIPVIRDVVSIGDVLLALGIFWAIVYSMTRPEAPIRRGALLTTPRPGDPFRNVEATSAAVAVAPAAAAPVAAAPVAPATTAGAPAAEVAAPRERGQSPYLALARNRNYSLLWIGQLLSFFGDRIHQVALGVLVLTQGSEADLGFVLAATAVPSILLGPLAGALVDRWDRRTVMIACDLVRAGLVLLVPLAITVHIGLVILIAFAVATVGLLFRPAKTAILPSIVGEEHLMTANSASTLNETLADIGQPIAAAIVAALAGLIAAAFVLDSATYLVSALLIGAMVMPREDLGEVEPFSGGAIFREMREGWRFLTHQAELFSNTVVSIVAQIAIGAEIVVSLIYAERVLDQDVLAWPVNYGWLMGALGLGSVIGGVAIGGLATRAPKGPMTIAGFVGIGLSLVLAGFVTNPYLAIAIFFAGGVANMLFLIPTITLFQQRTPQRLFGRVVSTRQALIFGAMSLAMGVSGWLAGEIGADMVFVAAGSLTVVAGLSGLLVPAMRNAR